MSFQYLALSWELMFRERYSPYPQKLLEGMNKDDDEKGLWQRCYTVL